MCKHQRGLNLIELLLVLAIVVGITALAFVIYPQVKAGRDASFAADVMIQAQAQIKSIWANNSYGKINNKNAVEAGAFPENIIVRAPSVAPDANFAWGPVRVDPCNSIGTNFTGSGVPYFKITAYEVPTDVCKKMAPILVKTFGRLKIRNTVVYDTYNATAIPFDEGQASTACNSLNTGVTMEAMSR